MSSKDYFSAAQDWSYDKYEAQKTSAKRWRASFFMQSGLSIILGLCLLALVPLKTMVPMPVYINEETGMVRVDRPTPFFKPEHEHMIKSDLVRYVRNREGYIYSELNHRIRQIKYASVDPVFKDYVSKFQGGKESLQDVLGVDGRIDVKVSSVVFLDSKENRPVMDGAQADLAKVDFSTCSHRSGSEAIEHWTATLSFDYEGLSQDEEMIWENWNGFTVSSYRLDSRFI